MVLITICVLFTVVGVSAEDNQTEIISQTHDYHSFTELNQSISQSTGELNLEYDYKYDNVKIIINKSEKFTINGNNHVLDGITGFDPLIFNSSDVVIINNLTFQNCINATITIESPVIFNNVKFINSSSSLFGGFIIAKNEIYFNNCIFQDDNSDETFINYHENSITSFKNSSFYGGNVDKGFLYINRANTIIENCTFENISSRICPAINYKGSNLTIKNSKFLNLNSRTSGGAIIGKFFPNNETSTPFTIENCEFTNLTSTNDGGAMFFDMDSGSEYVVQILNVINSNFTNCESKYGGAIANLGGILNIINSTIMNNTVSFEGGAIYTSWCNLNLINTIISNNTAEKNAGAIYFDNGKLTISQTNITNNKVMKESSTTGRTIYAHDADLDFSDSTFDNGGISVYGDFTSVSRMDIDKNNDTFSVDNENYIFSVESKGIHLDLINNTVIIDTLPSKFDSSDWGWVTPPKIQKENDDCWGFATVASIESSLVKSTGVVYDLSANYVQKLQLKYFTNGDLRNSLTGFDYSGLGYALSWYGALPSDNEYDDRGTIADTDLNDERIHLQDAMIIFGGRNDTIDTIKHAIINYSAVSVHKFFSDEIGPVNVSGDNISIMDHGIHFVSLIGWDDGYDERTGAIGYWITKDSLSNLFVTIPYNESTLMATDYYALVPQSAGIAYIFENNIDYHVNYQTDLTGLTGFDGNYTYYSNEFTSKYDELIGAVGTYFNESGIDYSFDVYVNDIKVYSQSGVSEFAGFRTLILNSYIPIKTGDKFKVVFKNNNLPYQAYARQHYIPGMSMVSADGTTWNDISLEDMTVCLKVYTLEDDTSMIPISDVSKEYECGSLFSVKVVTSDGRPVINAIVGFTIDGKTYEVKTNADGIATFEIPMLNPGKYILTATYKNQTINATVKADEKNSSADPQNTSALNSKPEMHPTGNPITMAILSILTIISLGLKRKKF